MLENAFKAESVNEAYVPQVGDTVSIEATIKAIYADGTLYIETSGGTTDMMQASKVKFISRKPAPLRLTLSQISERLGQEVEIVEE